MQTRSVHVVQWVATGVIAGVLTLAAVAGGEQAAAQTPTVTTPPVAPIATAAAIRPVATYVTPGQTVAVSAPANTQIAVVAVTGESQQVIAPASISRVYTVPGGSEITVLAPGTNYLVLSVPVGGQQILPVVPGARITITAPNGQTTLPDAQIVGPRPYVPVYPYNYPPFAPFSPFAPYGGAYGFPYVR